MQPPASAPDLEHDDDDHDDDGNAVVLDARLVSNVAALRPAPEKAAGIPDEATWNADRHFWRAGPVDSEGRRHGRWRLWAMNGALLAELHYDAGVEIRTVSYRPDGTQASHTEHDAVLGTTRHLAFHPDGKTWCVARYLGGITPVVAPQNVLSEAFHDREGALVRAAVYERDEEGGLVVYRASGPEGLRFENIRIPEGREVRFYEDGRLNLVVRAREGKRPLAFVREGESSRSIAFDGIEIDEDTREDIEGELGGPLFAATIEAMPRPDCVEAFARANPWAARVEPNAPFSHASIANFLVALASKVPNVADLGVIGLRNMVPEQGYPAVREVLRILEGSDTFSPAPREAREMLASMYEDEDDDADEVDDDDIVDTSERVIGKVTLPRGDLAIVDMGAMARWRVEDGARIHLAKAAGREHTSFGFAHVNAVCVFGLPSDRELAVVARRNEDDRWTHVSLVCGDAATTSREIIGHLSIEEARFMFADPAALDAWEHERSLDGLHDFIFFSGIAPSLARELGAGDAYEGPVATDYLGWADLPPSAVPPHVFQRLLDVDENRQATVEVRPHSHHHQILRQAWTSPDEAGTTRVGDALVCGLFTTVGDGVFPVVVERDARGAICRVTVRIDEES